VSLLAEASLTVETAQQAATSAERSLAEPAHKSSARRQVGEELFYRPGTATQRAVKELYEVLELEMAAARSSAGGVTLVSELRPVAHDAQRTENPCVASGSPGHNHQADPVPHGRNVN